MSAFDNSPYEREPWAPEQAERLRAVWQGNTLKTIAQTIGRPARSCQRKATKLGLGPRLAPKPAVVVDPAGLRSTPEGPEKRCKRCNEWWPADREFFYQHGPRGLHSWCKACCLEEQTAMRAAKKAAA